MSAWQRCFASVMVRCAVVFGGVASAVAQGHAAQLEYVRIGTGDSRGIYFQLGQALAEGISGEVWRQSGGANGQSKRLLAVTQSSTGSVANIRDLKIGRLSLAFAQADVSYRAYVGSEVFDGERYSGLRALSNLYLEAIHFVVNQRVGGKDLASVPSQGLRVSLGDAGSGTLFDARLILKAFGLIDDISPLYLHPKQLLDRLRSDQIDGFFFISGVPATVIQQALALGDNRLLPVNGPRVDALIKDHGFFQKMHIGTEMYHTRQDIETVGVGAQLMVDEQMPEGLAYQLCRVLWREDTQRRIRAVQRAGVMMQLADATRGLATPLHPGAARCYRDLGAD